MGNPLAEADPFSTSSVEGMQPFTLNIRGQVALPLYTQSRSMLDQIKRTHTHTCFIYQLCLRHHAQLICSNHGSTLTGHSSQQIHVRRTKRPGSRSVARGWVHQHYQNETKHTQFFLRWLFCVTSTCIRRWGLLAVYSSILHCWYPLKHGRWR